MHNDAHRARFGARGESSPWHGQFSKASSRFFSTARAVRVAVRACRFRPSSKSRVGYDATPYRRASAKSDWACLRADPSSRRLSTCAASSPSASAISAMVFGSDRLRPRA